MSKPIAALQRPAPGDFVIDHVSHFVPNLDAAARVLAALGFKVTPASAQRTQDGPAGSSNRCVMLAQGYLEFLSPTHDTPTARRMLERMLRYPGVHLLCFGTPAAEEEQLRLAAHGFAPLPRVALARPVRVGGRRRTAKFSVVRTTPERMPEGRIQYVEQLTPEVLWQPEHLRHTNGVLGLAAAFVVARNPIEAGARYARFTGTLPQRAGDFVHLGTARGDVLIGSRRGWMSLLGDAVPAAPALAGYALACRDPARLAARCRDAGLTVSRASALYRVRLPDALGGVWLFGTSAALAQLTQVACDARAPRRSSARSRKSPR